MFDTHGNYTDRMLVPEEISGFHPISYASRLYLPPVPSAWQARLKRAIDVAGALLGLALAPLVMVPIALAIWLDSPGPILFRQPRIGRDGQPFTMWKFRTMRYAPEPRGLSQAVRNDPRVTRVGTWLRRSSLDELAQFINVLRGEMSLVGPRPHAPGTRAGGRLFEDVTPQYAARHRVKPGMTGLAQIRGWRGETDTEIKLLRRVAADLEYIETWSLRLDLAILLRTLPVVARMFNAY
jgi:lipopolysaccharide/colanic/teichoic acid biosynthesis glycosyltransferase